jgi:hypothetical protein
MSHDNSIFILQTLDGFRTAVCHAPVNLWRWNEKRGGWDIDTNSLEMTFGNGPKYDSYEDAMASANQMHDRLGYVEYGICVVREFSDKEFNNLIYSKPHPTIEEWRNAFKKVPKSHDRNLH